MTRSWEAVRARALADPEVRELYEQLTGEDVSTEETLRFVRDEVARLRRSMRLAKPTPREGVQASLLIIERAVRNALGEDVEL